MRMTVCLAITLAIVLSLLAACAPVAPTPSPTKAPVAPTQPPAVAAPTAAPTAVPQVATSPAATPKPAAPTATPAPKIKRGGQLRRAVVDDWVAMDPLFNAGSPSTIAQFYETLIDWRPDARGVWGPAPSLAASWEGKADEIVFKLQMGVKFHDGSDWNADVAVWNLERFRTHPKSQQKGDFGCLDRAEKVDDYTVRARLKQPCASFLAVLSTAGSRPSLMISKAAFDKLGEEQFNRHPVGTGPFEFVEWLPTNRVTMKRAANYWRKGADGQNLPYLDGLVFRMISDDSVRLLEVKAGSIDFTERIAGKDFPGVRANPDLTLVEGPWNTLHYRMAFNSREGPFKDNLKLRQAALYAIDRESAAKVLGAGAGMPLKYVVVPGSLAYDESVPYYWYNPDKAKQLVKDAGFPTGMDTIISIISRELDRRQAEMLKQMWDAVGIRTTIDALERTAWIQNVRTAGKFQTTTMSAPTEADPVLDMGKYLSGKSPVNTDKFEDPEFDRCVDQANAEFESAKRKEIEKRCQTIHYNNAFVGYIWGQPWNWLFHKEVKGFTPPPPGEVVMFTEYWIDK